MSRHEEDRLLMQRADELYGATLEQGPACVQELLLCALILELGEVRRSLRDIDSILCEAKELIP